jgi:transketolase
MSIATLTTASLLQAGHDPAAGNSRLAARVRAVPPSGLRRFFDIAATMDDVISLSIGEPNFVTPEVILQAGIASLQRGQTQYTSNSGVYALRAALSDYLYRLYGVAYDPDDEILITVGSSEALYLAATAILDPGDEVIIPQPSYVAYPAEVVFTGATPVPVVTRFEEHFRVTPAAIAAAITAAQAETTRPSLIIGHTTMAKGCATMEGSADTHGAPLPEDELRCTKARLGLPEETPFFLPEEVVTHFRSRHPELRALRAAWNARRDALLADATTAARLREVQTPVWERRLTWPTFEASGSVATRKAFGACLMALADQLPLLVGGSADLDPSNQTAKFRDTYGVFHAQDNPKGRNICFGVREFPMAAMLNGMALHGGVVPFGATFLVFSDYARNAIRMSALQELPVLHVFTHDSFFVGEDGPTHQPVEHLWSLRLIPNLLVFRPADARETAACMAVALRQKSRPSVFAFTRQGLPVLDHIPQEEFEAHVARGGYILWEPHDRPVEVIVIATGSEVSLAVEAVRRVPEIGVRVVSMPCVELFDEQPEDYRRTVLPETITRRIAVEAGCTAPWFKYVGPHGRVLGLDHFGASAPAKVLQERYGFTPENLARIIAETR